MNNEEKREIRPSKMTKSEMLIALFYLPIHIFLLPNILGGLILSGRLSDTNGNLLLYMISFAILVCAEIRFLRRDYDNLCEELTHCIFQVLLCYLIMMALNMCVSGIVSGIEYLISGNNAEGNLNNGAILDMAGESYGKIAAIGIFLAPFTEELMFRGAIFAPLRKKGRVPAYAVSMAAFSVYHVWGYALADPLYWIFVIQYLPASFVLCRCYEKTETIWAPIALHMLVNGVSLKALTILEEML